jgi:hypothetical protein
MLHLGVCTCAQPLLLFLLVSINDTCLQPQLVRRPTSLVRQARQEAALLSAAGVRCVSPVSEQLRLGGQMPPLRQIQQEGESMYNRVNDVTGTTGFSQVNVNPSGHVICPAKASCVAWHGAVCS